MRRTYDTKEPLMADDTKTEDEAEPTFLPPDYSGAVDGSPSASGSLHAASYLYEGGGEIPETDPDEPVSVDTPRPLTEEELAKAGKK